MTDNSLRIEVASSPYGEHVAEIWSGQGKVCEINDESGDVVVVLLPNPEGGSWNLEYAAFVNALSQVGASLFNV